MRYDREFDKALSLCFQNRMLEADNILQDIIKKYGYLETALHIQLCICSLSGELERGKVILRDIRDHGIWMNPNDLAGDTDLSALRKFHEFQELLNYSKAKYEESNYKAEMKVFEHNAECRNSCKDIMLIHGRGTNYKEVCETYLDRTILKDEHVICIQSAQAYSDDRYCWDDLERSVADIQSILSTYRNDKMILAGVSQGARVAFDVFLQTDTISRLLLLIPALVNQKDELMQPPEAAEGRKIYIISGEKDMFYTSVKQTYEVIRNKGYDVTMVTMPDCGHFLPDDIDDILEDGLIFLK